MVWDVWVHVAFRVLFHGYGSGLLGCGTAFSGWGCLVTHVETSPDSASHRPKPQVRNWSRRHHCEGAEVLMPEASGFRRFCFGSELVVEVY